MQPITNLQAVLEDILAELEAQTALLTTIAAG
jgi:hypothetical protein